MTEIHSNTTRLNVELGTSKCLKKIILLTAYSEKLCFHLKNRSLYSPQ